MNQATPAAIAHWPICQLFDCHRSSAVPHRAPQGGAPAAPQPVERLRPSLGLHASDRARSREGAPPPRAALGSLGGDPSRSDRSGLPDGREPPHADARGRAPALQEARGRRPQLRPRPVRGGARHHRHRAALPQAPAPVDQDRRPVGVGGGRPVRHRAPRPPQRAAQAGPGARALRARLAAAQHPPGHRAPAVGVAPHRGAARRPGRDVHQAAPLARRRDLGDAAAAEHPLQRPRRPRHAVAVGEAAAELEGRQGPGGRRARCRPPRR